MTGLRCGVDIVEIARLEALMQKRKNLFLDRVFTQAEQAYCNAKGKAAAASYAVRFAAKEAVSKAFGTGIGESAAFLDIEVSQDSQGSPVVILHNEAKKTFQKLHGLHLVLSLTHERSYAVAQVVLQVKEPVSGSFEQADRIDADKTAEEEYFSDEDKTVPEVRFADAGRAAQETHFVDADKTAEEMHHTEAGAV